MARGDEYRVLAHLVNVLLVELREVALQVQLVLNALFFGARLFRGNLLLFVFVCCLVEPQLVSHHPSVSLADSFDRLAIVLGLFSLIVVVFARARILRITRLTPNIGVKGRG